MGIGARLLEVLGEGDRVPDGVRSTRPPCPGLWKTPVIRWDGQLMACCADVDGEILIGNLRDADFDALWFGEAMTRYRLWHVEGRFEQMPKCFHCGGINFYQVGPDEIREWLASVGRSDLFPAYLKRIGAPAPPATTG